MIAITARISKRGWISFIAPVFLAAALGACSSTGDDVRGGLPSSNQSAAQRVLTPNPVGEVIGNGPVRVALLIPTTIPGGGAAVARELRNGAEMAMQDFGSKHIQLVVKDTKGQSAEAQSRAGEAVAEGSSLIIGPLFAANVSAAAGVTIPADVPILAFSTDTTVARSGVYLFSYTPQSDTRRMISFAATNGSNSIVAFLPRNSEGNLRGRILQEISRRNGISARIYEYDRTPAGIEAVLAEASAPLEGVDSIYIPEGGPIPGLIVGGLKRNGVDMTNKQLLGSGAWESVKASDPNLQNGLYPGRDISRFGAFAQRYEAKHGVRPGVQGALAFDAVTLAAELARINGPANAYTERNFTADRGFQGTTGAFRIRRDGTTQRGLAIYRITDGRGTLVEPAVSSFSGRGGS